MHILQQLPEGQALHIAQFLQDMALAGLESFAEQGSSGGVGASESEGPAFTSYAPKPAKSARSV
jgi:hypothetical protein